MLKIENIETYYGRIRVLNGIWLQVTAGEVVCVIGPNGAGKTTLLNSICGVTPVRRGTISFSGNAIHTMEPAAIVKCGISQVPEGRRIFGKLSVRDNLVLGAYVRRKMKDKQAVAKDMEYIFDTFTVLKERQDQQGGSLSGGEQQMLAIGRALMSAPKLLLLDEPSLGLAPLAVAEIFQIINRLRKQGVTILLIEQNVRIALKIADRGYVLETGNIVLDGKTSELRSNETIKRAYLGD